MIAAAVLAAGMVQASGQRLEDFLERKDFVAAWAWASQLEQPQRARTKILLQAGDPAGALAEARLGLQANPSDLELLFAEATSAVWVRDAELAQDASKRLHSAVMNATLAPEDRAAWESAARKRMQESLVLLEHQSELRRAGTLSKALASGMLAAAAGAAALSTLLRGDPGQGRSRSPVS